jgi:hypothetical protein
MIILFWNKKIAAKSLMGKNSGGVCNLRPQYSSVLLNVLVNLKVLGAINARQIISM